MCKTSKIIKNVKNYQVLFNWVKTNERVRTSLLKKTILTQQTFVKKLKILNRFVIIF